MAKSGIPILVFFGGVAALCALIAHFFELTLLRYGTWLFSSLSVFTLYFFRDPQRAVPQEEHLVVSAADGRVVKIARVPEGMRVSVFMTVFNVHVNRIPCSGRVERVTYHPGRFFSAFREKASDENERTEIVIVRGTRRVIVTQIAGVIARRIVCRLKEGDVVHTGERFGMIKFGSRVDLTLPAETEIKVRVGDRVRGGQTIIGVMRDDK